MPLFIQGGEAGEAGWEWGETEDKEKQGGRGCKKLLEPPQQTFFCSTGWGGENSEGTGARDPLTPNQRPGDLCSMG